MSNLEFDGTKFVPDYPVTPEVTAPVPEGRVPWEVRPCEYVATSAVTDLESTAQIDLAGNSLVAGDRALFPVAGSGAYVGIYRWDGARWIAVPTDFAEGTSITILRSAGGVEYRRTGTATLAFELIGAPNNIDVDDPNIYWSHDNVYLTATSAAMLTAGSYCKFRFFGTSIQALISVAAFVAADTPSADYPMVRYRIDNDAPVESMLTSTTTGVGTGGLANTWHEFRFEYVSSYVLVTRWATGAPLDSVIVTGFAVNAPAQIRKSPVKSKYVRFDGDSIIEGVYARAHTDARAPDNSAYGAWPYLVATALDAEHCQLGYGGTAWGVSNGVPAYPDSVNLYGYLMSRLLHHRLPNPPDIWFINFGQNDSSDVTQRVYNRLFAARYEAGPECEIMLMIPFSGARASEIIAGYNAYVEANTADLKVFLLDARDASISFWDGVHPDIAGHVAAAASVIRKLNAARYGLGAYPSHMFDPDTPTSLTVNYPDIAGVASCVGTAAVTQATAALQPHINTIYHLGTQIGLGPYPALVFPVSDLRRLASTNVVTSTPSTTICVLQVSSYPTLAQGNFALPFLAGNIPVLLTVEGYYGTYNSTQGNGVNDATHPIPKNRPVIVTIAATTANQIDIYLNGGQKYAYSDSARTWQTIFGTGISVGNRAADGIFSFDGFIFVVLRFARVLTQNELARVHAILAARYNIQLLA